MPLCCKRAIKNNFAGKTVISVKPSRRKFLLRKNFLLEDFYATIFLIGLESILTQRAEMQLFNKYRQNQRGQAVNNMVSFNRNR